MLASQLLEVASEAELEHVLRDLSTKARRGIEPAASDAAEPLAGLLKTVTKKALPPIATAVGGSNVGRVRDATAEKLGSLLDQALRAKVAGMPIADPDLKKCRQLFERYRQFVRLAGKATRAAAAAPSGVTPVAVARQVLSESARKTLTETPTAAAQLSAIAERPSTAAAASNSSRQPRRFVESAPTAAAANHAAQSTGAPAPAAASMNASALGPASRRGTPTGAEATAGRVCTICDLPEGSCQCRKFRRTGRWFRDGTSIVVNC